MKKAMLGFLCLFLAACSTQQNSYKENCFVSETKITDDMKKIQTELTEYYRVMCQSNFDYRLKRTKVICELFGKNNKQLAKELDKIENIYRSAKMKLKKAEDALKANLKGLKLDLKQVISFAKYIEPDLKKIADDWLKQFTPYKSRAIEILKILNERDRNNSDYREDDIDWGHRFTVRCTMFDATSDTYKKAWTYNWIVWTLRTCISEGVLADSFLSQHESAISPKDEPPYTLYESIYFAFLIEDKKTESGEDLFEAAHNAVEKKEMTRDDLSELLDRVASCMRMTAYYIASIQEDVTDVIDKNIAQNSVRERVFGNFSTTRQSITGLVDKNPKIEDFKREIDKLSTRLAYKSYYETDIIRFLYKGWKEQNYDKMKQLFKDALILADRLHVMVKDEVVPENSRKEEYKHREYLEEYKHKRDLQNISDIKEIACVGVEKILSEADHYVDSQEKIKESLKKDFMKTREFYLAHKKRK